MFRLAVGGWTWRLPRKTPNPGRPSVGSAVVHPFSIGCVPGSTSPYRLMWFLFKYKFKSRANTHVTYLLRAPSLSTQTMMMASDERLLVYCVRPSLLLLSPLIVALLVWDPLLLFEPSVLPGEPSSIAAPTSPYRPDAFDSISATCPLTTPIHPRATYSYATHSYPDNSLGQLTLGDSILGVAVAFGICCLRVLTFPRILGRTTAYERSLLSQTIDWGNTKYFQLDSPELTAWPAFVAARVAS